MWLEISEESRPLLLKFLVIGFLKTLKMKSNMHDRTPHGIAHAGFLGFRSFVARKKFGEN
jgi:hypothetical protein